MEAGINRNSRIWQVPAGADDDPLSHALGPAPDDHHAGHSGFAPALALGPGLTIGQQTVYTAGEVNLSAPAAVLFSCWWHVGCDTVGQVLCCCSGCLDAVLRCMCREAAGSGLHPSCTAMCRTARGEGPLRRDLYCGVW